MVEFPFDSRTKEEREYDIIAQYAEEMGLSAAMAEREYRECQADNEADIAYCNAYSRGDRQ